jgi:signal transduction histidine kinase
MGQPQNRGLRSMNRAFSHFAHVVGFVCLCGAALGVIGYQGADPSLALWPALIPIAAAAAALVLLDRRRTTLRALAFLLVGGASLYWFDVTVFAEVPAMQSTDAVLVTLFKVALVLVGGSGYSTALGVFWCTSGFVIAALVTIAAALQTGARIGADGTAIAVEVGLVTVFITIGLTRARLSRAKPQLDRAAIDEQISAMRYRIEVKAAALMHDTVLNHLNAVVKAEGSALRPELKRRIEHDLDVLVREEWLNDPSPEVDDRARSDWKRSALLAAVQEARELSLAVDVTGDLAAIGRLSADRDLAVGLAVKQCLVNVNRHAGIDRAEVVIIGAEHDVSIMVIDAGRGFTEALVGADRLGLRQSVRRRIEAVGGDVQLWSTPGRGTSVMIRVPAGRWPDGARVG